MHSDRTLAQSIIYVKLISHRLCWCMCYPALCMGYASNL